MESRPIEMIIIRRGDVLYCWLCLYQNDHRVPEFVHSFVRPITQQTREWAESWTGKNISSGVPIGLN